MKKLRRLYVFLLSFVLSVTFLVPKLTYAEEYWPEAPGINARAGIIIEAETGAVLYEKNIHEQLYPASITKIMTTLLALENCSLEETVTFSYDSVHKIEGTHIGIKENEQLTMEQCLYAVMLGSANEVSYAVAEHVGGTFDNFIKMMNEKAVSLGCTETHFSNPHGLPDETHVTSAHDMALIAQAAYSNPTFRSITKTVLYTIPTTNITDEKRYIANHHKMLKQGEFKYEYCTGGKTGYTDAARNTLVTYAENKGLSLICVVMRTDGTANQYNDTRRLLDYGFNNFKKLTVTEGDLGLHLSSEGFFSIKKNPLAKDSGKITLEEPANLVLPNQINLTNVTSKVAFTQQTSGEIAHVNCNFNSHYLGNIPIIYTPLKSAVTGEAVTKNAVTADTKSSFPIKTLLLVVLIILCSLGFILVVLYIIRNGLYERDYSSRARRPRKKQPPRKKHKRRRRRR